MNPITVISSVSGTSSGGSLISRSLRVICIAGALSIGGTDSVFASTHHPLHQLTFQTNSGLSAEQKVPAGPAIMELRRLSGMTWGQLASLFEVTRRTLHFWASGKALNAGNEEKLYQIVSTIRQIDKGSARENRDALYTTQPGGIAPIALIRAGYYDEVVSLLGHTPADRPVLTPLSREARFQRMPVAPEILATGLQDKIHSEIGPKRAVRAVRVKNKNQGDNS